MKLKAFPQFYGVGSDPEFLFVHKQEFQPVIVPANTVILGNRTRVLRSFIGTDGHPDTAEMRPGPSHNVVRHMYDIAFGLHETDKWLAQHKRLNQVKIVAQPFVANEPLGGHIHCSFFIDEPETLEMAKMNRTFSGDRIVPLDSTQPIPALTPEQLIVMNEYARKRHNNELLGPHDFAFFMDYLLLPHECAVQPWWDRIRRNSRFGGASGQGERVRQSVSTPKSNKASKLAYLHYEYRVPSTWLCHPWLAYSYLGLAKLAILNAKLIREVNKTDRLLLEKTQGNPANSEYMKLLTTRLKLLVEKGRWTNDIKALQEIIPKTFEHRNAWFEIPGNSIDIDAWRRLL